MDYRDVSIEMYVRALQMEPLYLIQNFQNLLHLVITRSATSCSNLVIGLSLEYSFQYLTTRFLLGYS